MMPAIAADMQIGLELAIKQHLFAARAFVPEVVRHRFPANRRADLRQDEIRQPAHRRLLAPQTPARKPNVGCPRRSAVTDNASAGSTCATYEPTDCRPRR